jgi:hypothetical protein
LVFGLAGVLRAGRNPLKARLGCVILTPMTRLLRRVLAATLLVTTSLALGTPVSAQGETWTSVLNGFRALGGMSPVTEVDSWSDGAFKHSRYMVENNTIGHTEDPSLPFYSAEGLTAAQNGNVSFGASAMTAREHIQTLLLAPFHGLMMVDPRLSQSGFGIYDGGIAKGSAATLDVWRGYQGGALTRAWSWPTNDATVPNWTFDGGESPDPFTSCPGYTPPTGFPIYMFLPGQVAPTASSMTSAGSALPHCLIHAGNYTNPHQGSVDLVRNIMGMRSAVIVLPKTPLEVGKTYTVSVTNAGTVYSTTFSVGTDAIPPISPPTDEDPTIVTRSLTLQARPLPEGIRLKGSLEAAEWPACRSGWEVSLLKKKDGGWRELTSTMTDAEGMYSVDVHHRAGRFQARVVNTYADDHLCAAAASPTVRVKR